MITDGKYGVVYTENKWPVVSSRKDLKRFKATLYLCGECRCFTYLRYDPHKGESICENCGHVFDENMIIINENTTNTSYIDVLVEEKDLQSYFKNNTNKKQENRIKWLEYFYDNPLEDKQEWRLYQYHEYIGVVNTHFHMTNYQKDRVWYLIQKAGDLKEFHRQYSYEQIVTALCIGVMKADGRRIQFNDNRFMSKIQLSFVDEINLDEEKYLAVMEKLAHLKTFSPSKSEKDFKGVLKPKKPLKQGYK